MGANFSRIKTWIAEILTPGDLNAEFDNILNNFTPSGLDDYSANTSQMQTTADPYPGSVESLATSAAGEFERIRYVLKQITGKSQWYIDPDTDLATHYAATAIHGATGAVVGTTNTQTLTNKTLTSPKIGTSIVDTNGNTILSINPSASAVNYLEIVNAPTASMPKLKALGSDTNIDLELEAKGTGRIKFNSGCLGAWDATKAVNTNYQASTDLMVHGWAQASSTGGHGVTVIGYSDSTATPSTIRQQTNVNNASAGDNVVASVSIIVKKGDYWKISAAATNGGSIVSSGINIIPIG